MPATDYTRVTVYLTEQEKQKLQALANKAGLKLSSYIKQKVLGDDMNTTVYNKSVKDNKHQKP